MFSKWGLNMFSKLHLCVLLYTYSIKIYTIEKYYFTCKVNIGKEIRKSNFNL